MQSCLRDIKWQVSPGSLFPAWYTCFRESHLKSARSRELTGTRIRSRPLVGDAGMRPAQVSRIAILRLPFVGNNPDVTTVGTSCSLSRHFHSVSSTLSRIGKDQCLACIWSLPMFLSIIFARTWVGNVSRARATFCFQRRVRTGGLTHVVKLVAIESSGTSTIRRDHPDGVPPILPWGLATLRSGYAARVVLLQTWVWGSKWNPSSRNSETEGEAKKNVSTPGSPILMTYLTHLLGSWSGGRGLHLSPCTYNSPDG